MKPSEIKTNGTYRIIDNICDHGFEIGEIVKIVAIEEFDKDVVLEAESTERNTEWCVKPEEIEPVNPVTLPSAKLRMIVESLLDEIEDLKEGMGTIMYNEIASLYGYPFKWVSKR